MTELKGRIIFHYIKKKFLFLTNACNTVFLDKFISTSCYRGIINVLSIVNGDSKVFDYLLNQTIK